MSIKSLIFGQMKPYFTQDKIKRIPKYLALAYNTLPSYLNYLFIEGHLQIVYKVIYF